MVNKEAQASALPDCKAKISFMPFILLALVLVPLAFAQTTEPAASPYMILVPGAIMVTISVISIAYIIAKAFSLPALEAWTKIEMQEALISALVLCIVLAVVTSSNAIVAVMTGVPNYMSAAQVTLASQQAVMRKIFTETMELNHYIAKIAGFSYSQSAGALVVSAYWSRVPMGGLSALSLPMATAMDQLSLAMLTTSAQKLFLQFFAFVVPTFMLPLALVLRTFPLTRKIGAALIAVAIGLYILFPFSIILGGAIYNSVKNAPNSDISDAKIQEIAVAGTMDIGDPPLSGMICSKTLAVFTSIGELGWGLIICIPLMIASLGIINWGMCYPVVQIVYLIAVSTFPLGLTSALQGYVTRKDWHVLYNSLYNNALPAASMSLMLSLVLFLLAVIITVSATRAIAVALGGEGQLYGLSKLV